MEQKKPWQIWDEVLVAAWEADAYMGKTAMLFLQDSDLSREQILNWDVDICFSMVGVDRRSPKIPQQLRYPVRAFFHQFFPKANDLLWDGKEAEALAKMLCYKVGMTSGLPQDKDLDNLKRDYRRKSSPLGGLPLIPGTNAMNIRHARREMSDWGTVKPPGRQRGGRL